MTRNVDSFHGLIFHSIGSLYPTYPVNECVHVVNVIDFGTKFRVGGKLFARFLIKRIVLES